MSFLGRGRVPRARGMREIPDVVSFPGLVIPVSLVDLILRNVSYTHARTLERLRPCRLRELGLLCRWWRHKIIVELMFGIWSHFTEVLMTLGGTFYWSVFQQLYCPLVETRRNQLEPPFNNFAHCSTIYHVLVQLPMLVNNFWHPSGFQRFFESLKHVSVFWYVSSTLSVVLHLLQQPQTPSVVSPNLRLFRVVLHQLGPSFSSPRSRPNCFVPSSALLCDVERLSDVLQHFRRWQESLRSSKRRSLPRTVTVPKSHESFDGFNGIDVCKHPSPVTT